MTAAGFFGVEVGRSFDVAVPLCAQPDSSAAPAERAGRAGLVVPDRPRPAHAGWTLEQANAQLAALSPGIFQETVSPN